MDVATGRVESISGGSRHWSTVPLVGLRFQHADDSSDQCAFPRACVAYKGNQTRVLASGLLVALARHQELKPWIDVQLRERPLLVMWNAEPCRPEIVDVERLLVLVEKPRVEKPSCVDKFLKADLLAGLAEPDVSDRCIGPVIWKVRKTLLVGRHMRRAAAATEDITPKAIMSLVAHTAEKLHIGLLGLF